MDVDRDISPHRLTAKEVLLSARIAIAEFGANAASRAEIRISEMLAAANGAVAYAWTRILKAIRELQSRNAKPA